MTQMHHYVQRNWGLVWLTLYWLHRLRDYVYLHACQNGCWLSLVRGSRDGCWVNRKFARVRCWESILMILYWNCMIYYVILCALKLWSTKQEGILYAHASIWAVEVPQQSRSQRPRSFWSATGIGTSGSRFFQRMTKGTPGDEVGATEAFSVNCLPSIPAFAGCFLVLNDVYWVLRSTKVFVKVSWYFYDESEFIVASLSPLRGQSFLS